MIRRSHRQAPHWNAWSFARFDIWAQRRLAASGLDGRGEWQRRMALWVDRAGQAGKDNPQGAWIGAAFFCDLRRRAPQRTAFVLDPAHPGLAAEPFPTLRRSQNGAAAIEA